MRSAPKKYNTLYKKGHVERDMYLPRLDPKGVIQCSGCGAFHHRRHWTLTLPAGVSSQVQKHLVLCPACRKIQDSYPEGELTLRGIEAGNREEIARILRNEESRAREKNPLERIMRMDAANGGWRIETTTEKLAQRLGRSIKKARGGKLAYKWGHNNKFVRVSWQKEISEPSTGKR
jgi:NMD protein affecting ribosome stability and mRNA decay